MIFVHVLQDWVELATYSDGFFLTFCGPCIVTYLRNKDQQDALFSLNLFSNHPLHVSSRLTIHHQEVFYCISAHDLYNTKSCIYSNMLRMIIEINLEKKVHFVGPYYSNIVTDIREEFSFQNSDHSAMGRRTRARVYM